MKKVAAFIILIIAVSTATKGQTFRTATATAQVSGGFVVGITVTDGGYGYTNVPPVHIVGGGGTNALVTASVSNNVVTAITVNNPGSGYSSTPTVNIAPPIVPLPSMSAALASQLVFSNLGPMGEYELQENISGVWSNQYFLFVDTFPHPFTYVANMVGAATTNVYRLVVWPPDPEQATAVAQVTNGFVVGVTMTDNGSGYSTGGGYGYYTPIVEIIGGGGSGAQATANVSFVGTGPAEGQGSPEVVSITINNPGSGYTSVPTVVIGAPPPSQVLPPPNITPLIFLGMNNLATNLTYQVQSSMNLDTWSNVGTSFVPNAATNLVYLTATNSSGFFRLQYIP